MSIILGVILNLIMGLEVDKGIGGRAFFDTDGLIAGKIFFFDVPQGRDGSKQNRQSVTHLYDSDRPDRPDCGQCSDIGSRSPRMRDHSHPRRSCYSLGCRRCPLRGQCKACQESADGVQIASFP